jgi:hypothetical protein
MVRRLCYFWGCGEAVCPDVTVERHGKARGSPVSIWEAKEKEHVNTWGLWEYLYPNHTTYQVFCNLSLNEDLSSFFFLMIRLSL